MSWFTGRPPARVHAHGTLVLDVADIHHAAVLMRAHADAAAQVADDEFTSSYFLPSFSAALRPTALWFRAWNWHRRRNSAKPV